MGQKVNPNCFRTAPTLYRNWSSILYADKDYSKKLFEDLKIRDVIKSKFRTAQISNICIKRSSSSVEVNIHAKKPGIIIGKSGNDIAKLKELLNKIVDNDIMINIYEIKKPALDANIVAQSIASQLENRVSFRKAMKTAMQNCLKQGGKGIRVECSGRLAGAEIARTEWYREGSVPLHTLRADIDYAKAQAMTMYGVIGVKLWIYRGEYDSDIGTHRE
ncbi:30S ribosomal protein S3 [Rickettsia endosymbiont of Cardiosporidium cionae]|uniref:30S ribosomal protein S3 n=1 Tax=Rickettsia endosymbiont of Cardiosporidium cionae TaxID=2777155 RepID=UPI001895938F|nr:30S ribosomal protein S3 [Rickettsia endosymbiont of Cardiosporidium cionae]KAF8818196.1 30S ribosomal protein S3 [Rickettsia endosymbiont of Cardiosporidium cionae]